ncbi:hypothetical protein LEN26_009663 [Aphanomyces euteiches]|nr:hypothetical protein AeMF1_011961 [Aphanomyces euteiches]KAH9124770.1 hypothetical protein LEN26_009663 [Aphanomyces euteiches]KAH9181758.1 hypothetical protein AeNC1_016265 [Aphanomyces euteiches]
MAFLTNVMLCAGILEVFCMNYGMKAPIQSNTWFSRVFKLIHDEGHNPSFAMVFGLDARDLVSLLNIPKDTPHEEIWGFDPELLPMAGPCTTLYSLFSDIQGTPALSFLKNTEEMFVESSCAFNTSEGYTTIIQEQIL